jgi:hypothetical protein
MKIGSWGAGGSHRSLAITASPPVKFLKVFAFMVILSDNIYLIFV